MEGCGNGLLRACSSVASLAPTSSNQQGPAVSAVRFTQAQQGIVTALLVVVNKCITTEAPMWAVKEALLLSTPCTEPFIARLPDKGTALPSIRDLEQSADPALLNSLNSLRETYVDDGVRPLAVLSSILNEGLSIVRNARVRRCQESSLTPEQGSHVAKISIAALLVAGHT